MTPDTVIEHVCNLPLAFRNGGKSPWQLVRESGFPECTPAPSADALSGYLALHPELVEQWLGWSEDKRVSSGWYFMRQDPGYVVAFYPNGETLNFTQATLACAEFVVREVRSIASIP